MITYTELWKAKQAWTDMSKDERGNYLAQLGPAIQHLMENGVQIVSWGKNESSTYNEQLTIILQCGRFQTWSLQKPLSKWLTVQAGTIILTR